jgi:DNA-binding GntR family transcriptional regulator
MKRSIEEHALVLEALCCRDGEKAQRLMCAHIASPEGDVIAAHRNRLTRTRNVAA